MVENLDKDVYIYICAMCIYDICYMYIVDSDGGWDS